MVAVGNRLRAGGALSGNGVCHSGACHDGVSAAGQSAPRGALRGALRVALVGAPNVGKSALFNRLTGAYVTVSNYPGTSVEVSRGHGRIGGVSVEVLDTPGMYSLLAMTEEERVARRIVLDGGADVIVHVVDAKNLTRMLPLTLQLAEAGPPLIVALNMMDEAAARGLTVDVERLALRLGTTVVPVVAVEGQGIEELGAAILGAMTGAPAARVAYGNGVGEAIASVRRGLVGAYAADSAAVAALLLQGDEEMRGRVAQTEPDGGRAALAAADEASRAFGVPPAYRVAVERQRASDALADGVLSGARQGPPRWVESLGRLMASPATGIPVLLLVLYLGLYKFVGQFGAGTLVDWLEGSVFEGWVNPFFERLFAGLPWTWARDLFAGEYGILTLGVRYAVAIVLPIVGTFFLFFSLLEDSGYFPRLALLVDRAFKRLGLNGRAVIPLVLGFACDTMATMVTRTLETRRERVLATLLLALAIPCSAQLGVILAILAGQPLALGVWMASVLGTFVLVGALAARLLPGRPATFHMELPPLRRPRAGNVLTKTYARMHWYFLEVLPLFLLASVLLWAGRITGIFERIVSGLAPVVGALGLPRETASVFIFGFFRRDYGAAGLYDLNGTGVLDAVQLTVAAVTLTLFVPCVAQFLMMVKERGTRTAVGMFAFATVFAFTAGFVLNLALRGLGL
ncbi:MAG: ferrous iron transport protein B [Gemmatimonadetes bacterium]|nr:ferrous iron transport protein B [Gemmatimonadota bacterium]